MWYVFVTCDLRCACHAFACISYETMDVSSKINERSSLVASRDRAESHHTASTVNFDPLTQPSLSPESENARLLISPSPVQAFVGSISLARPGEGVFRLSAAGVVGGERE